MVHIPFAPGEQQVAGTTSQRVGVIVQTVKVVNDAAERELKLNTDYAKISTDDEEQRAAILQAVERHRKEYPDFFKYTLSK